MHTTVEASRVPSLPLPVVARRVDALWDPQTAPHHMVFGKIRSGKTHLITRGLLSLCEADRVLIIDAKGDDPAWDGYGRPVREIPDDAASGGSRDFWYRLVADRAPKTARKQVARALDTVAAEGHFVVVVDEVRG
ncbi:hypothetical protein [Streptomyces sp. NPDC005336]|uniref:hypothetical protein n=1 Tax=Streptomyces sp. NPDC005336 TaxID=3157035 RepID=UPI0033A41946